MQAYLVQISIMKDILNKYALSTRLKINFHKSSLVPINLSENTAQNMAALLECNIAAMSFTYLCLPLGTTKPSVQEMVPLIDKLERRVFASFLMMPYSGRVSVVNSLIKSMATLTICSLKINPRILETVKKMEDIVYGIKNRGWGKKQFIGSLEYGLQT
jgi:hypothetical protein